MEAKKEVAAATEPVRRMRNRHLGTAWMIPFYRARVCVEASTQEMRVSEGGEGLKEKKRIIRASPTLPTVGSYASVDAK